MLSAFRRLLIRVRALYHRSAIENEFDEELRFHLERDVERLVAGGMTAERASAAARRGFGNVSVIKHDARLTWSFVRIEALARDVRLALRGLRRSPGFSAVVLITLALGIGATTAIFTVFRAVLLRPLPYPSADAIVSVSESKNGEDREVVAASDYFAWRESTKSFSTLALYVPTGGTMTGGSEPVEIRGAAVSADFFSVLGVTPAIGRTFRPAEDLPGGPRVALLSHAFWERAFGSDSGAVGRSFMVDGNAFTVIGVMGASFAMPRSAAYWTTRKLSQGGNPSITWFVSVIGRLRDGASIESAHADLAAIVRQRDADRPASLRGVNVVALSLHDRMFGTARPALSMLLGGVIFLLAIACANVANLMIARSMARRRELAVRLSLGATHWHLVRQRLAESLLLSSIGGALGLAIPVWTVAVFARMSPASVANVRDIHVDGGVLAFAALVSVATGVIFGVGPALADGGRNVLVYLKQGAASTMGSTRQRFVRATLVIGQTATALVLLTGAALMLRSLSNALAVNPGFQPDHLHAATVYLSSKRYPDAVSARAFFQQLRERVHALPGIDAVVVTNETPLEGMRPNIGVSAAAGEAATIPVAVTYADFDYPRVVGLQLVKGRLFDETDKAGSPGVALVSVAAVSALFPGGQAIGRQLPASQAWDVADATVIGVVNDVPQRGVEATPIARVYLSLDQSQARPSTLIARIPGDAASFESAVRHTVAELDPLQTVLAVKSLETELATAVAPRRLNATMLALFAGLALLLAAVGLYGVLAYQVAQRSREIGLRIALGAEGARVLALIVREGMRLAIVGAILGVTASYALTRFLGGMLFAESIHDPTVFAAAPTILLIAALVACYVPARNAAQVDPMIALRAE